MKPTIIVTGATGFTGKRLAKFLSKTSDKNKILFLVKKDRSQDESSGREYIENLRLKTKEVDLVTKYGLRGLPSKPKLILHLAANTNTTSNDHRVNDIGTKNLINAIKEIGPKTHVIYTSTTVHTTVRDMKSKLDENTKPYPTNEYGRTKLKAEKILIEACKKYNFKLTILRLNTIYGKNPRKNSLFAILKRWILAGSIISRLNWPGLTSIINVDDVVKGIILFSKRSPKPGKPEIYILHAESLNLAQISKIMHKALKKTYKPISLPEGFWKLSAKVLAITPYLENILPPSIYNSLWRSFLIVDNVIYCQTNKARVAIPKWKPKKLSQIVKEII